MCRSLCDGGRRCPAAHGAIRRSSDRARYSASKAAALPAAPRALADQDRTVVGGGAGEPVTWEQTKGRIRELQAEITDLLDRAEVAGSSEWFDAKRARRSELADEGRSVIEVGEIIDVEFPHSQDLAAAAEAKVIEVGALVDAEVLSRVPPMPVKPSDDALAAAVVELDAAIDAVEGLRKLIQAGRTAYFAKDRGDPYDEADLAKSEAASAEWDAACERRTAAAAARRALLVTDPDRAWRLAQAAAAREVIGELRQLGDIDGGHVFHSTSQKKARDATRAAFDSFPTDWLARSSAAENKLSTRVTKARAHYVRSQSMPDKTLGPADPVPYTFEVRDLDELERVAARYRSAGVVGTYSGRRRVKRKILAVEVDQDSLAVRLTIDGGTQTSTGAILTTDGTDRCTVHELSHRMEDTNPRVLAVEAAFYRRRTVDENGEQMPFTPYLGSRRERVIADGFVNEYVGKTYDGRAYEVLSVGMEAVFAGAQGALLGVDHETADRDHRAFVLGTLVAV